MRRGLCAVLAALLLCGVSTSAEPKKSVPWLDASKLPGYSVEDFLEGGQHKRMIERETILKTKHAEMLYPVIKVTTKWSSLLQADVKREANELVQVEIFKYVRGSRQDMTDACRAAIVAHDANHDLALLELQGKPDEAYVAKLLPADTEVMVFEDIWACGAALLHPPMVTDGILNYLDDVIDRKKYWLGSASIIYGNSGGAVFIERDGHYYWIGVPSRVAVTYSQAVTHMGFFVPVTRFREWVRDESLLFLIDGKSTPEECFAKRAKQRKRAELQMVLERQAEGD